MKPWEIVTAPWGPGGRVGAARVGVLTVIEEEFDELSEMMEMKSNILGYGYYVRKINENRIYDIVLTQLDGRGNTKSSTRTSQLIEDFRPQYILLVGIAGGVKGRDGTDIADVIVPNFVHYYEMRKLMGGKSLARYEPYDHPATFLRQNHAVPVARRKEWIERVKPARRPIQDGVLPTVKTGLLISGEKLLGDDEANLQQELLTYYDNALAIDMESFGVGCAVHGMRSAHNYNPQYLVIRGISDLVRDSSKGPPSDEHAVGGLTNDQTRQTWKAYAAHVAAAFALAVAENIVAAAAAADARDHGAVP